MMLWPKRCAGCGRWRWRGYWIISAESREFRCKCSTLTPDEFIARTQRSRGPDAS